jgi:GTPase
MLSLAPPGRPGPAIVRTVASEDRGVDQLLKEIEAFRAAAGASGLLERKRRDHLRQQFEDSVGRRLLRAAWARVSSEEREATLDRLVRRELDPFHAAEAVLRKLGLT